MKTLGITLGDINGIGPEVALKAVSAEGWPRGVRFALLGDPGALEQVAALLRLPCPPILPAGTRWPRGVRTVIWPGQERPAYRPGCIRADASRAACAWVHAGVEHALAGRIDALVTAPICKEGLQKAGVRAPGHTEMLATWTGTRRFAMMLMGGGLRVVLVTRHMPLAQVPAHITRPAVTEATTLALQALEWLGLRHPSVGVAALNPHAGDGGALGHEERRVIAPAVRAMRRKGLAVTGPVPGDVIFYQALHHVHGAVVCMYHDQGLGPLKMLGFDEGVNLTLGLPIIRTSPDHGTAFDMAGLGQARETSMKAALETALQLTRRVNPWQRPPTRP